MLEKIFHIPVIAVEKLKTIFHTKTYHIERVLVLLLLIIVATATKKGLIEYIGVTAVFFTFNHASIAEYMREAEEERTRSGDIKDLVECHTKLPYYFYAKELCWFTYFFLLGAYSALVGVFIFLLYQPWRRLWRKYHPR